MPGWCGPSASPPPGPPACFFPPNRPGWRPPPTTSSTPSASSAAGPTPCAWPAAVPGVGRWTAAEVARAALGDADAVSEDDYHLPHQVAWTLAGEARADDARMLELLEPYRGHRGRVIRLIEAGGLGPPRFGPRMPLQNVARL